MMSLKPLKSTMTRGQLAKAAGLKAETIRFYDNEGLLPTPTRNASGYRLYSGDCVGRLVFIKQAQALGFSLNEVRELLSLQDAQSASQSEVKKIVAEKLAQIQLKIQALQDMHRMLSQLDASCEGTGDTSSCHILNSIQQPLPTIKPKN